MVSVYILGRAESVHSATVEWAPSKNSCKSKFWWYFFSFLFLVHSRWAGWKHQKRSTAILYFSAVDWWFKKLAWYVQFCPIERLFPRTSNILVSLGRAFRAWSNGQRCWPSSCRGWTDFTFVSWRSTEIGKMEDNVRRPNSKRSVNTGSKMTAFYWL